MTTDGDRPVDLIVVGGGIAGLAAAWAGHRRGWTVRVFERDAWAGGKIRSERCDGYLIEWGPTSFLGSAAAIWQLVEQLGLQGEVVRGRKPTSRFVFRGGRARKLPTDPWTLLFGDWLSFRGKLRLLREPFVDARGPMDESVADFARRRLGDEAAQFVVAPFVAGVWAGDPERLPAREAFPKLWQWEQRAGSVVRGAWRGRHDRKALPAPDRPTDAASVTRRKPGLYSLRDGLGTLPDAIVRALPQGAVVCGATVEQVQRAADGFAVTWRGADGAQTQVARSQHLIVAAPAGAGAALLGDVPAVAATVAPVASAKVAVVHFGGPDAQGLAPRGFGVLAAPGQGQRALGVLFPSSVFAGRAPEGHYLCSAFLGGACDPAALDLGDGDLLATARSLWAAAFPGSHLERLPAPFVRIVRWPAAIPQYAPGHRSSVASACATLENTWPGATLCGSYVQGISMADSAQSGFDAVARLAACQSATTAQHREAA